jgi:hypothetical protein
MTNTADLVCRQEQRLVLQSGRLAHPMLAPPGAAAAKTSRSTRQPI